ncbi:MAG TPA: hypothetical protein GX707_21210 [Epulopiscium sp.]|nr:hypothetical protein [Candidatus Epulonipiscium sp.]
MRILTQGSVGIINAKHGNIHINNNIILVELRGFDGRKIGSNIVLGEYQNKKTAKKVLSDIFLAYSKESIGFRMPNREYNYDGYDFDDYD